MGFSLKIEYVALILNCVLFFFYYEKNMHLNFKKKCYIACLTLSMVSIVVNILSVVTLNKVSDGMSFFLNGLYYPAVMTNASMMAFFLFHLMFEHVPQRKCSKIAYSIIATVLCIVIILTLANIWTNCLFTIEQGVYSRGPLNAVGYAGVGLELCLLVICFFRNRRYISAAMTRLIEMLPVAVAVLLFIQLRDRDIMMNGIISAMANLILFIISQSNRLEQDPVTELKNRTACVADINRKIRKKQSFQFVTINLKNFSFVNRKFSHAAGDECLYQIARYLEKTFREGEIYRVGGVEFVMLIPYVSREYADHCCQEVLQRMKGKWELKEAVFYLRAGICNMICENGEEEAAKLIEQMQYMQALVKETNESVILNFEHTVKDQMERRKYLISRMKRAMKEDGFEVHFQPIYCWEKDSFTSMESLVRMRDEDGSLISPMEFIPIAEEVGLIDQIGWIVLDKVCAFMSSHKKMQIETASINMSMQQFNIDGFVEKFEECLKKYELDSDCIRIEITERMTSENTYRTRSTLQELAEKGIGIYLDDFGMGYSNFAGVLSLPIDTVKLDLTLVHGAFESERKYLILESLVTMLRRAGYSVVAEGIETEEQADTLKKLGADKLQGSYYHRPMPENELIKLFHT
ncbi:MAG: phosphodiesterase [Anaerotignum sp.]|nr:phosphodiesterase [Anaerotignum sp.]